MLRGEAHRLGGYIVTSGTVNGAQGYVPESVDLMRAIKMNWDEHGLLNPGAFTL
jgi:hypothetical protein